MVCTKHRDSKRRRNAFRFGLLGTLGALSLSLLLGFSSRAPIEARADNPVTEEVLEADRLSISLNSSATTVNSHSFSCTISSTMIETISNRSALANVFVVIDDPATEGKSITQLYNDGKEASTKAEEEGEEYIVPHYAGYVYRIYNTKASKKNIVIPRTLFYHYYYVDITGIGEMVCTDEKGLEPSYKNIETIAIPNTITTVESNAFPNCPDSVSFKIEEETNMDGFAEDWTDAKAENIRNDVDFVDQQIEGQPNPDFISDTDLNGQAAALTRTFGKGEDFLIRKEGDGYNEKMWVEYNTIDPNGNVAKANQVKYLDPINDLANYDGVGSDLGSVNLSLSLDFATDNGESVDPESIRFHNIRKAKSAKKESGTGTTFIPDPDSPAYVVTPNLNFRTTVSFEEAFTLRQGNIATFAGYTRFGFYLTRHTEVYPKLKPNSYRQYQNQIAQGNFTVRMQFSNLTNAYYRIYLDGVAAPIDYKIVTPISNFVVEGDKEVDCGFLVEDKVLGEGFSADKVRKVELCHFSIRLELFREDKNARISRTDQTITFASLPIITVTGPSAHNLNATTAFAFLIFIAVYAAGAVGYYFYAKNRFKNDEFRRVNGKKFLIEALKNGLGLTIVFGAIYFIYARWGLFKGSVVTFNPFDAFVVVFTIAGVIYIGFSIKNIVISVKNTRKRKQAARLHLDQDKDDDGTN